MRESWQNIRDLIAEPSALFTRLKSEPKWGVAFVFLIAKKKGCSGGKACGAGGGGCLVFCCHPDRVDATRQAFVAAGGQVIPFRFDFQGLRIWSPQ